MGADQRAEQDVHQLAVLHRRVGHVAPRRYAEPEPADDADDQMARRRRSFAGDRYHHGARGPVGSDLGTAILHVGRVRSDPRAAHICTCRPRATTPASNGTPTPTAAVLLSLISRSAISAAGRSSGPSPRSTRRWRQFPVGAEVDTSDLSGPHEQLLVKHSTASSPAMT